MPGNLKPSDKLNAVPRSIKNNLKDKRIVFEEEHPLRWSFMKVLREYSTLKEFYPDIDPYVEAYKVRENTWALYSDSFDGAGDVWMYLIDGPEKAMLIDDSFGVGNLKGLVRKLVGDKPLIVANTHSHFDHCYGNAQFDEIYCHEYEVADMETKNNPDIWDYLFNNTDQDMHVGQYGTLVRPGEPIFTQFDKNDIIVDRDHRENYRPYKINGIPDGYEFDLGDGYIVEAVLLPGHTPGQCGYYDHHDHTIFIGDTTSIGGRPGNWPHREYCTVEALYNALVKLQPRFHEIEGVFSGHSVFDESPVVLQYLLDTLTAIMKDPENCDVRSEFVHDGIKHVSYAKNIFQWTRLRYSPDAVTMEQVLNHKNSSAL